MVLGLLFLSHDWTAHPMWLQRGGMTLPLLLLLLLPLALNGHRQMPTSLQVSDVLSNRHIMIDA